VVNQARYIINAFLILFLLSSGLFIFKQIIITDSIKKKNNIIVDVTNDEAKSGSYGAGKSLFSNNCASCHSIMKDLTGPALAGLEERGPWKDRKKLYEWVHNPPQFMTNDNYTRKLKEKYGVLMTAFPDLAEKEIDAIVDYINSGSQQKSMPIAFLK
jgi:mono/diheme cytochrome c family protein